MQFFFLFLFSWPADADIRVIIVCAVLVNKTQRVSGNHNDGNLIVPAGSADTTVSSNGRVYVKYNDYDFYPLYLMFYQRTPEHLNESKYFRNNPRNKWQQKNRAVQQQQQQRQQELEAQRERELQAQRQRELRAQREQEWREQELEKRRRVAIHQKLRRIEQEQQERRRLEREQDELMRSSRRAQARQRESNSNCLILWWLCFNDVTYFFKLFFINYFPIFIC